MHPHEDDPKTGVNPVDRIILGIPDVAAYLNVSRQTASLVMHESGRAFRLHSRLYIMRSAFLSYLLQKEGLDGK